MSSGKGTKQRQRLRADKVGDASHTTRNSEKQPKKATPDETLRDAGDPRASQTTVADTVSNINHLSFEI